MYHYPIRISEMIERGYSAELIREASAAEQLYKQIEDAFAATTLGDGISLREARARDDYLDSQECRRVRELDEQHDWKRVSVEDLNRYTWSFAFFDACGVAFYLPAILLADLTGRYNFSAVDHLTNRHHFHHFESLSKSQREVVRQFLNYALKEPCFGPSFEKIQVALDSYWSV